MFLNEPSAGVDPIVRRWMLKFMEDNLTGRTMLLTTHVMDEVEKRGNRIGNIAPQKPVLKIFLDLYHDVLPLLFS